jgi:hypothetical protein
MMKTIDENDKVLGRILSYGVEEAPAELELLVRNAIEVENAPRKSYMGLIAGWVPVTISLIGLVFGVLTSAILFFPNLVSLRDVFSPVFEVIVNPSVMIIVVSVIALVIVDSLLEKRMSRFSLR